MAERAPARDGEPELSVVLPCLDEAAHLAASLAVVRRELERAASSHELIVVDDGSSDETWRVLRAEAARDPRLRALRLSRRFGKESAVCAGLERARGRAIVVMDADLQHPPALLTEMTRAWRDEGYDVVEGVKADRGREPWLSKAGAGLFHSLFLRLSGTDLRSASDFKLLDRRVLDAWLSMHERGVFFRGMSAWLGFRRKQVPFAVAERAGGSSSWSTLGLLRLAVTGLTSFSALPIHVITLMGGLFLVFALGMGALALVNKLRGVALTGFTTVILLQLLIGSMLMIGLGVLGEYVARIYDEVKGRPRYVVAESLGERPPAEAEA